MAKKQTKQKQQQGRKKQNQNVKQIDIRSLQMNANTFYGTSMARPYALVDHVEDDGAIMTERAVPIEPINRGLLEWGASMSTEKGGLSNFAWTNKAPKKPRSASTFFMEDNIKSELARIQGTLATSVDARSNIMSQWTHLTNKYLPDGQKNSYYNEDIVKQYRQLAEADEQRYQQELSQYKDQLQGSTGIVVKTPKELKKQAIQLAKIGKYEQHPQATYFTKYNGRTLKLEDAKRARQKKLAKSRKERRNVLKVLDNAVPWANASYYADQGSSLDPYKQLYKPTGQKKKGGRALRKVVQQAMIEKVKNNTGLEQETTLRHDTLHQCIPDTSSSDASGDENDLLAWVRQEGAPTTRPQTRNHGSDRRQFYQQFDSSSSEDEEEQDGEDSGEGNGKMLEDEIHAENADWQHGSEADDEEEAADKENVVQERQVVVSGKGKQGRKGKITRGGGVTLKSQRVQEVAFGKGNQLKMASVGSKMRSRMQGKLMSKSQQRNALEPVPNMMGITKRMSGASAGGARSVPMRQFAAGASGAGDDTKDMFRFSQMSQITQHY